MQEFSVCGSLGIQHEMKNSSLTLTQASPGEGYLKKGHFSEIREMKLFSCSLLLQGSVLNSAINEIKVWQNAFVEVSICVEFIDFTTGATQTAKCNEFQTASDLHLWFKRIRGDLQERGTIWRLCKFENKMAACQILSV